MNTTRTTALSGCGVAIALTLMAGVSATAQPQEQERIDYEDHFEIDCGGMTYPAVATGSASLLVVQSGRSGLPHFTGTFHETVVYTNPDTGRNYTGTLNGPDRDLTVTDNGDGTLTLVVQTAGVQKWHDAEGRLLFIDSGMNRFELLVDHNGTPADPSDDEEATFVQDLRELTGKNDTSGRDFCEDLIEVTG